MPYLQCFRLRYQADPCSVLWNTHPKHQCIHVLPEVTWCCNSSITSMNYNSFSFKVVL
jgi:hypothetical protein